MNYTTKKEPVILSNDERDRLLKIVSKRYAMGIRNRLILNFMVYCGLRVSEITNLKPRDISITDLEIKIKNGKGGKDRTIDIPEALIDLIKQWKDKRPKTSDYFFCNIRTRKGLDITVRKDGQARTFNSTSKKGDKISVRYIQAMIKRYALKAGIDKDITPHTLRHTYATNCVRDNIPLPIIQEWLGHSYLSTTQIYTHLAGKDRKEAIKKVTTGTV